MICDELTEFKCPQENACIDKSWVCDGTDDCFGNEDEAMCPCENEDNFKCSDGTCLEERYICDGHPDCSDGDDEEKCATKLPENLACDVRSFSCDGGCYPTERACDGFRDCLDGSDEQQSICSSDMCLTRADVRRKVLSSDFICDHLCRPTPSGPRCLCYPGFELESDGTRCKLLGRQVPWLYFSVDNKIMKQSLLRKNEEDIVYTAKKGQVIKSIVSDVRSSTIFWIDEKEQSILSYDSRGKITKITDLMDNNYDANSFSFDWEMKNFYVTYKSKELKKGLIKVFQYKSGSNKDSVFEITSQLTKPTHIVLDPIKRVAVVVDTQKESQTSSVQLFGMNGVFIKTIAKSQNKIKAINIDHLQHHLYWIESTNLMGEIKLTIFDLNNFESKPFTRTFTYEPPFAKEVTSLAIFNNEVIFSDASTRKIWRIDSITANSWLAAPGGSHQAFVEMEGKQYIGALFVSHTMFQPQNRKLNNAYKDCLKAQCSHLCLPHPTGISCTCPTGMKISNNDDKLCIISTTKAVKPLTTTLSMVTNVSKSTTVFPKKCLLDKNNIENYILSEKQVRREYFAGESVFVECKKGYYLKRINGKSKIKLLCGIRGTWKNSAKCLPFSCVQNQDCGQNGICRSTDKTSWCECNGEYSTGPCKSNSKSTKEKKSSEDNGSNIITGIIVGVVVLLIASTGLLAYKFCRPKLNANVPWSRLINYDPELTTSRSIISTTSHNKRNAESISVEYEMRSQSPSPDLKSTDRL